MNATAPLTITAVLPSPALPCPRAGRDGAVVAVRISTGRYRQVVTAALRSRQCSMMKSTFHQNPWAISTLMGLKRFYSLIVILLSR